MSLFVSLCLVGKVISDTIIPALGKLKQIEMLLFHSSAIALHCVLGHDRLLSQCLPPPRYTNGYRVNIILGLALHSIDAILKLE